MKAGEYDMSADASSFSIDFSREPCRICGSPKPLVSECPQCGAEYRTTDPLVSRRWRIVEEARKTIAVPLGLGEPVPWVSLVARLQALPEALSSALATAQLSRTESDAASAIHEAFLGLSSLTADVARTPHLRPLLSFWTEVERLIDLLWGLYDLYLQAFQALTPRQSQQFQKEGQVILDGMVPHSQRLDDWTSAVSGLETETPDHAAVGLIAAMTLAHRYLRQPDLLSFDAVGLELLRTKLVLRNAPEGLGVAVATLTLWADQLLNSDRIWQCAREVMQLYVDHARQAKLLLNGTEWQDTFNGWSRQFIEATIQVQQMDRAPLDSAERYMSNLATFSSSLIEGASVPMLRSLLAVQTRRPLSSFRRHDVAGLLQELRSLELEGLTEGISVSVRDAGAHHAYSVEEETITFTSGRRDVASTDGAGLLDLTLALVETSLALHLGTVAAVVTLADDPESVLTKPVIRGEAAIRLSLAMYGLSLVSYTFEGSLLVVRMAGASPKEKLQVVASMVGQFPPDAAGARFVYETEDGVSVVEGPLAPWREWSRATDDEDRMAWFMTGARTWQVDGQPRFGGDQLRLWGATVLLDALDLSLRVAAKRMRLILRVATLVGDHDLGRAAERLLGLRRVQAMQLEPASEDHEVVETLREWAKS